ncbi:MAG: DUF6506 family protein [Atribacterota bacterium]
MMEKVRIAFMYVADNADPDRHHIVAPSPEHIEMNIVAVKDFEQAKKVALKLVEEGTKIIELCGGFGYKATAKIKDAVGDTAEIGAVRFDKHPGLNNKSGDDVF